MAWTRKMTQRTEAQRPELQSYRVQRPHTHVVCDSLDIVAIVDLIAKVGDMPVGCKISFVSHTPHLI